VGLSECLAFAISGPSLAAGKRGEQTVTEPSKTSASSTTTETATDALNDTDCARQGVSLIRRLAGMNLGLTALQPLSAGLFLSGYERAVTVHAVVAQALAVGALIQAVTAVVLWRWRRVPAWIARFSIGLFIIVFLQVGLGYRKTYWLHVPIGVGILGLITRQAARLDTLRRTTGGRS
jgi:hypothetical protein